jgi:hypothetical protein
LGLRKRNKEILEVWLKLYVGQLPKTGGMINLQVLGKPSSSVPVPNWVTERCLDGLVKETDLLLARRLNKLMA